MEVKPMLITVRGGRVVDQREISMAEFRRLDEAERREAARDERPSDGSEIEERP